MKATEIAKFKKKLIGTVVSDKSSKTIVVAISRRFKDRRYNKFVSQTKKYHAHDEEETASIGDKVVIIESKPLSRLKKWELFNIVK